MSAIECPEVLEDTIDISIHGGTQSSSERLGFVQDTDQPFTLGVRLEVDFDGFFRREDAADQLRFWREAHQMHPIVNHCCHC